VFCIVLLSCALCHNASEDTVNQRNSSISSSSGGGGARKHARKHARKKSAAVWRQGAGALCASDSGSEVHLRDSSESILKAGAIDSGSNSSSKELSELKQVCVGQQSAITTAVRCVLLWPYNCFT
jgi:hypothetical protein